jgi:hypothetical protein
VRSSRQARRHTAIVHAPRWSKVLLCCALGVVALDAISTQWGAALGVAEGNPYVLWLRGHFGPLGAEFVFDACRVAGVAALFVFAATAANERIRTACTFVLAGFIVLAAPVLVGNFRILASA